ncbi:MAG: hypothetical protein ABIA74_00395 [bacterium]
MDYSRLGFVFKRFLPYKKKVSILDQNIGKINLISVPADLIYKLWPGMVIKYNCLSNDSKNIIANKINIIACQQNVTKQSILWFHALLELCYYSLPLHLPANEIFDFLCNSYLLLEKQDPLESKFVVLKKIYVLKLIELLGLSSCELPFFCPEVLSVLSQVFIDFSNKQKVESVSIMADGVNKIMQKKIDLYIGNIIKNHPYYKNFKVNYLIESGS